MDAKQEGLKVGWVYGDKVIEFPIILQTEEKKDEEPKSLWTPGQVFK
jgi:hypothetical protein